jgi:hypothetical protein
VASPGVLGSSSFLPQEAEVAVKGTFSPHSAPSRQQVTDSCGATRVEAKNQISMTEKLLLIPTATKKLMLRLFPGRGGIGTMEEVNLFKGHCAHV